MEIQHDKIKNRLIKNEIIDNISMNNISQSLKKKNEKYCLIDNYEIYVKC